MPSSPGRGPLPERVDIIILGGGVNGVAIARKCAQARKSVLLVERDDFACGTSSRSSRIVYGGLHALQRGSFRKVREALHGRAALLHEQPHLVQPSLSSSPMPVPPRATPACGYAPPSGSTASSANSPQPAPPPLWNPFAAPSTPPSTGPLSPYQEAQCEFPERLVAEWLRDACNAGAIVRNHSNVLAIRAAEGRVRGVLLRDTLTGEESYVESEWVINATGPWVDLVRDLTGLARAHPSPAAALLHPSPGAPPWELTLRIFPRRRTPVSKQGYKERRNPCRSNPCRSRPRT